MSERMVIDQINSVLTTKTDWIVENGERYPITHEQLLALQVLVKKGKVNTSDFKLLDADGNQLTIREDGRLCESSTTYTVVKNLLYELM